MQLLLSTPRSNWYATRRELRHRRGISLKCRWEVMPQRVPWTYVPPSCKSCNGFSPVCCGKSFLCEADELGIKSKSHRKSCATYQYRSDHSLSLVLMKRHASEH